MDERRKFSDDEIPRKTDDYHGTCQYVRTQPDIAQQGIKSVNIEISFEHALRLSLALQSAVLNLNRTNRNTTIGREMGILLSIKTDPAATSMIEKRVRREDR